MKVDYRCYLTGHTDIALSSAEPEHLHLVGCGNQITVMSSGLVKDAPHDASTLLSGLHRLVLKYMLPGQKL